MSGGAFLFGKMPAHGDFVARGLAAEERDALDAWLSREMVAVRAQLGDEFAERFDRAPPWCFAWPGDDGWTGGAMAPSVDSVGRRFPLMVGVRGLDGDLARSSAERCLEAIFDALGDGWNADQLVVATLEGDARGDANEGWWTDGGEAFDPAALPGRQPDGLVAAMLTKSGVIT